MLRGERVETFLYYARVDIPIPYNDAAKSGTEHFFMGNEIPVAGLPYQPDDYDVILGMDLIGIFHVTLYKNVIILSN